VDRGRPRTG